MIVLRTVVAAVAIASATPAHAEDAEDRPAVMSPAAAASVWTLAQLVPSPLLVIGGGHLAGGLRWQITPFVYSFGVAARPVRAFVVDPVARHSGAVEIYASPEWACCASDDGTGWLARGGARVYLPIVGRGESLSGSIGGSYYRASGGAGGAIEVGAYTLFGVVGLTVTVSPALAHREIINALTIRYF
ncbi:MAG TPA: hypothetical protein VNO21_02055, partial [Polyangiaceae bacterium]|nr:hypothetical protein [Polyangiaceae bacterium]